MTLIISQTVHFITHKSPSFENHWLGYLLILDFSLIVCWALKISQISNAAFPIQFDIHLKMMWNKAKFWLFVSSKSTQSHRIYYWFVAVRLNHLKNLILRSMLIHNVVVFTCVYVEVAQPHAAVIANKSHKWIYSKEVLMGWTSWLQFTLNMVWWEIETNIVYNVNNEFRLQTV